MGGAGLRRVCRPRRRRDPRRRPRHRADRLFRPLQLRRARAAAATRGRGPGSATARCRAGGCGLRADRRLVLGVAILVAAKVGAIAVLVLVTAVLVVAAFELYETLRTRGYHPATLLGLVGTASMLGAVYWKGEDAMPLVLSLFVVFTFLWYLAGVVHARPAMNVAITVMAFMYVGFLGSFAALLLRIPGVTDKGALAHDGVTLFLLPVIATVAYDVGAFAIGGRTGRTPLAPGISPNKTWEGLVGATIVTFVVTLLIQVIFKVHPWTVGRAFWLAASVCVTIKRDLGVKDMGRVMPGHGGVLDRIDGLLFVAPAAYYLLRILKFA
ncbi:MAG: hypothetical protein E6G57_07815 [Actinobacteria bacterium]|nr:MAG: hypothetical protein E6G57_07815 [Actinomycetota bacterium]